MKRQNKILVGFVAFIIIATIFASLGDPLESGGAALQFEDYSWTAEEGKTVQLTSFVPQFTEADVQDHTDVLGIWVDTRNEARVYELARILSGGDGQIRAVTCDFGRCPPNAEPWDTIFTGYGEYYDAYRELRSLKLAGTPTTEFRRSGSSLREGSSYNENVISPQLPSGATSKEYIYVNLISTKGHWGWLGNERSTAVNIHKVLIYDSTYCGVDVVGRGNDYCFSYGQTQQGGRPYYCDERVNQCKNACAGCAAETGRCLASYITDSGVLRTLLETNTDLCLSNQYVCSDVGDCGNYIKQFYGNTINQNDVTESLTDYDKFQYGAHCDKANPDDALIRQFNALVSSGDLGVCSPGAVSWRDCDNDNIFGSANGYRFIDWAGNFDTAKSWGVNAQGQCVLVECAGPNDCPEGGGCEPKVLVEKEKSGLVGVCSRPKIESECEKASDCATACAGNQNPLCTQQVTSQGYVGICDCIDKPDPTINCRTQESQYSDDAYCMLTRWSSLASCTQYECVGDATNAQCQAISASCSVDSDCDVDEFRGYGRCDDGCCIYGEVPPPPPDTVSESNCDDGIDNDEDGDIDCQDQDCRDLGKCGSGGGDNNIFSIMVGLLVGVLTFAIVFSYRKQKKNKLQISLLVGLIVGVIVALVVWSMDLNVGDPFQTFTPQFVNCAEATAGAWLPTDKFFCDLGNQIEALRFIVGLIIAGITTWFALGVFRKLKELTSKPAIVLVMLGIVFISTLWIALTFFWWAIFAGILFAIVKWVIPGLGGIGGHIAPIR
jgi:hypothetical protein